MQEIIQITNRKSLIIDSVDGEIELTICDGRDESTVYLSKKETEKLLEHLTEALNQI